MAKINTTLELFKIEADIYIKEKRENEEIENILKIYNFIK